MAAGDDRLVAIVMTTTDQPARSTVHLSADGVAWDLAATIDGTWIWEVVAGPDGFVAVGDRRATPDPGTNDLAGLSDTVPVIATSRDGRAWDVVDIQSTPGAARDVVVTPSQMIVVGKIPGASGRERPAIWTSSDDTGWERRGDDVFADVVGDLDEVATIGTRIVATGKEPRDEASPGPMFAWASDDGATWELLPRPPNWGSTLVGGLAAGDDGLVLAGAPFGRIPPLVWRSTDGRSWDEGTPLPLRGETDSSLLTDVAVGGGRQVVVGDDVAFAEGLGPAQGQLAIWTSDDAETWTLVPFAELDGDALGESSRAARVVHDGGRWLVYGTTAEATDAPVTWVVWIAQTDGT